MPRQGTSVDSCCAKLGVANGRATITGSCADEVQRGSLRCSSSDLRCAMLASSCFARFLPSVGAWLSLARAPGSGPGGRWFKSTRPDHFNPVQPGDVGYRTHTLRVIILWPFWLAAPLVAARSAPCPARWRRAPTARPPKESLLQSNCAFRCVYPSSWKSLLPKEACTFAAAVHS